VLSTGTKKSRESICENSFKADLAATLAILSQFEMAGCVAKAAKIDWPSPYLA